MIWKEKTAYEGERIIGWYVSEDGKYKAVFCPEGTPVQKDFASKDAAIGWIEEEFRKGKK